MSQPATIIDAPLGQTVKHGSFVIPFNSAGNLICEDFQFEKGSKGIEFQDAAGPTYKAAYSTTKLTGSMVVQFNSAASGVLNGDSFSFAGIPYLVTSIGETFNHGGAAKIQVQFVEKLSQAVFAQPNIYDGEFYANHVANNAQVTPVGNFIWSHPIPLVTGALVVKQKFVQHINGWAEQQIGTNYPGNNSLFLVDESPLEDTGVAGLVTWWRTWATIPPSYIERASVTKTYKYVLKAYNPSPPNALTDANIVSQPKTVKGDITYNFSRDPNALSIGRPPDVSIVTIGGTRSIWRTDGFPDNGNTNIDSNDFYCLVSGEMSLWMGDIYCRKEIRA